MGDHTLLSDGDAYTGDQEKNFQLTLWDFDQERRVTKLQKSDPGWGFRNAG